MGNKDGFGAEGVAWGWPPGFVLSPGLSRALRGLFPQGSWFCEEFVDEDRVADSGGAAEQFADGNRLIGGGLAGGGRRGQVAAEVRLHVLADIALDGVIDLGVEMGADVVGNPGFDVLSDASARSGGRGFGIGQGGLVAALSIGRGGCGLAAVGLGLRLL